MALNGTVPSWQRLDLVEDPFQLSANPRYLYLGDEHLVVYRNIQGVIARTGAGSRLSPARPGPVSRL